MKEYKVFKHPSGRIETVKQGWSWPAFFFSIIWSLTKRMWGLGVGVIIGSLVVGFIIGAAVAGESRNVLVDILGIIANIIFGAYGNSWREKNLASRGFEDMDTVTAANPEGAEALYLKAANAGRVTSH